MYAVCVIHYALRMLATQVWKQPIKRQENGALTTERHKGKRTTKSRRGKDIEQGRRKPRREVTRRRGNRSNDGKRR